MAGMLVAKKPDAPALTRNDTGDWLTIAEAADRLGVSLALGYRMAQRGQLPTLKAGRRRVVPRAWLEERIAAALRGERVSIVAEPTGAPAAPTTDQKH